MNIVRTHINEKFSQDSDPIRDLNIGIFTKKYFNNDKEAVKYLFSVLPAILGTEKIPKDTIEEGASPDNCYKWDYFWKIANYCDKYMYYKNTGNSIEFSGDIYDSLANKLRAHGYQKKFKNPPTKRPKLNEKFTQESDPISDLGIGMKAKIIKWLKDNKQNTNADSIVDNKFRFGSLTGVDALLAYCAERNNFEFVKYLVEADLITDINAEDGLALRWATARGNVQMIKFLIKHGANPDGRDSRYNSLACAIMYDQKDAIKYLIKKCKITDDVIREAKPGVREQLKKIQKEKDGKSK